jgi:hypothetical protein
MLVLDFNKYIRTFDPSGIKVIRAHDQFVNNASIKTQFYCKFMGKGNCVDLIHPNNLGLDIHLFAIEG